LLEYLEEMTWYLDAFFDRRAGGITGRSVPKPAGLEAAVDEVDTARGACAAPPALPWSSYSPYSALGFSSKIF
jgi:hypothetical protein